MHKRLKDERWNRRSQKLVSNSTSTFSISKMKRMDKMVRVDMAWSHAEQPWQPSCGKSWGMPGFTLDMLIRMVDIHAAQHGPGWSIIDPAWTTAIQSEPLWTTVSQAGQCENPTSSMFFWGSVQLCAPYSSLLNPSMSHTTSQPKSSILWSSCSKSQANTC